MNKHWNEISDKEFIELAGNFKSRADFARSFGLKKCNFSMKKRIEELEIESSNKHISEEDFRNAVEKSTSIAEVITSLGYRLQNSRYREMKYYSNLYGVSLPVFDTSRATESAIKRNKLSDSEYFAVGVKRNGQHLRTRLIKIGRDYHCSMEDCPLNTGEVVWLGKPITLQVDHIDGDHLNNLVENLRFVCANCHTQTETYSNKKRNTIGV